MSMDKPDEKGAGYAILFTWNRPRNAHDTFFVGLNLHFVETSISIYVVCGVFSVAIYKIRQNVLFSQIQSLVNDRPYVMSTCMLQPQVLDKSL